MSNITEQAIPKKRAGTERPQLSRAEVVSTALHMIDAGGFHALTMRGLARQLGVFPAAVYWHAGTKSELLALISEEVLQEIRVPDVEEHDWKEWIMLIGLRSREVLGQHPRFAAYFVTNIQVSFGSLRLANAMLEVLDRAGFAGEDLVDAYNVLFGSIFGWTGGELAEGMHDVTNNPDKAELARLLAEASPAELAHIRKNWARLADRTYMMRWTSGSTQPMDSSFKLMLRTLIEGMAARLTA